MHLRLVEGASPFTMVAGGAGGDNIFPGVQASHVPRYHMVNSEGRGSLAAILASVIIATEDFPFCEADARAGSFDHPFEANDRGTGDGSRDGPDLPSTIQHHASLASENEAQSPPGAAHVDGFKIRVED